MNKKPCGLTAPQLRIGLLLLLLVALNGCAKKYVSASVSAPATPVIPAAATEAPDRKVIRNAAIDMRTSKPDEIPPAIDKARRLALDAGGYVIEETSTTLVLRIPDERLDAVISGFSSLARVTRKSITARDVSAEYTDLDIRNENARNLAARLRGILQQAGKVTELLEVERELARVTTEIEQLEGQKRLMENQIALATLRLAFSTDAAPPPQAHMKKGPLGWTFYHLYRGVKWLFVRGRS